MSEETSTPKTTTEENTPKITAVKKEKDPKRVEAGKRFAAISKSAKEKKMSEKMESEQNNSSMGGFGDINHGLVFGFIGTAVVIVSLYYRREEYKREVAQEFKPVTFNENEYVGKKRIPHTRKITAGGYLDPLE